jgi:hypothetical protein
VTTSKTCEQKKVEPADEITLVDNITPVMVGTPVGDALMKLSGITYGNYLFGIVGARKAGYCTRRLVIGL